MKQRKEIEETLAREKLEVEKLKNQQDEINEQLRKANEQKLALELQIAGSDCIAKDLEEKLLAVRYLLHSLQAENEVLQQERDDAVKEAEQLRQRREQSITSDHEELNVEFSYSDLEQATQNFSDALKIGEGGFGRVYKGFLRNTAVAIKMLHPGSLEGRSEFHQEVISVVQLQVQNNSFPAFSIGIPDMHIALSFFVSLLRCEQGVNLIWLKDLLFLYSYCRQLFSVR